MPHETDDKALQELVRVLEEAILAGASSVGLALTPKERKKKKKKKKKAGG